MTPLHALTSGDPGPRPQSGHWFYLGGVVSGRRMDGQTDREGRREPSLPLQASSPGLAASGARRPLYVTQSAHRTAFSFLLSSLQAEGRGPWRSGRNGPGPRQQLLPRSARPHRRPHSEGDQRRHPALPAPPSVSGTVEVRLGSTLKHAKDPWGNPSGPVCLPGPALGPADRPPAVAPAPSTVASILGPLKAAAESRRALMAEQRCPPPGRPWGRQPLTGEAAGGGAAQSRDRNTGLWTSRPSCFLARASCRDHRALSGLGPGRPRRRVRLPVLRAPTSPVWRGVAPVLLEGLSHPDRALSF